MINAEDLILTACKYIGTPYSKLDCQKFWEKTLSTLGLSIDLGGSNSWYRYIKNHGWVGTPEECKARYGCIPHGATLFIRENVSADTPDEFKNDNIGDITHMGVYTGMTGEEMCKIAEETGVENAQKYDFGNGAIHSSSSRGYVCTSKFSGKTIPNGGWNRVGLFTDKIIYPDIDPSQEPEPKPETAVVYAPSGKTVNMRSSPKTKSPLVERVPIRETVVILQPGDEWCRVQWNRFKGYMQTRFLIFNAIHSPVYSVTISGLTKEQAQALCREYPNTELSVG